MHIYDYSLVRLNDGVSLVAGVDSTLARPIVLSSEAFPIAGALMRRKSAFESNPSSTESGPTAKAGLVAASTALAQAPRISQSSPSADTPPMGIARVGANGVFGSAALLNEEAMRSEPKL